MEFQQRKLRVALAIILIGLAVALAWHGWQGWGLGRGYPYNTFLLTPELRFSDFTDYLHYARSFDPYSGPPGHCNLTPASYLFLYPLMNLPTDTAMWLYLGVGAFGLFLLLERALRAVVPQTAWRLLAASGFLLSYPVIYAFDRGNNDLLLVPLTALSLVLYSRKKFTAGFLCLLPPICCKIYPALLLLLFLRRRLIHWAILAPVVFLVINWLALLTFISPVAESWTDYQMQLRTYNNAYNLGHYGIAASASAWNLFTIFAWLVYAVSHGSLNPPLPPDFTLDAYYLYNGLCLLLLGWVLFHVLIVEKVFVRRAIVLLLDLTVSLPGGGDYKLMYAGLALVILVVARERRPADLIVTAVLALALIPKREILLPFLGHSDSGYRDASLNVIVNPLCLLLAMALLMWDGWQLARPLNFSRGLAKLARVVRVGWLTPARPRR
jgi:hypothetical protein